MNHEKLDKLPDSMLTEVKGNTEVSSNTENSVNSKPSKAPNTSPIQEVSQNEIFSTGAGANTINTTVNPAKSDIPTNTPTSTTSRPVNVGNLVGGKFAVDLLDTLFPALVVYLVNMIGYELDKKGLQMTAKEKEIVIPAMQDYLNSIKVDFNNPLYNLLFAVGAVYGAKVIEILPNIEKKKSAKVTPENVTEKAADIEKRIQEQSKRKQDEERFIKSISNQPKEIAIKMIMERRRKSKQDATEWYNKNVKK